MCWNKDVSINTFVFACLAIGFIFFANTYTKYKIEYIANNYVYYLFFLSFSVMQLIEYFLWISIETKDSKLNKTFSIIGFIIILLQPIFALFLISKNIELRDVLLSIYLLSIGVYLLYSYLFKPIEFVTTIGKNHHLKWNWLYINQNTFWFMLIWYFCIFFGVFTEKKYYLFWFTIHICIALYFIYTYWKTQEWGSLWCLITNSILLYYILNILIYQPLIEYKEIC